MQRHMQNISFLVIVGVLLIIAFFISEQTRVGDDLPVATATAIPTVESREDLPDCSGLNNVSRQSDCYQDAAAMSQRLVENLSDQILEKEADSSGRMAFLEMQQAWEVSRDADCGFVQDQAETKPQGEINRDMCLVDHNLARLDQLEVYFCDYYDKASCEAFLKKVP